MHHSGFISESLARRLPRLGAMFREKIETGF
jgi:hypothetical protein